MKSNRLLFLLLIAFILLLSTAVAQQPTQAQGQNLLVNPGFDGQYASFTPQTPDQKSDCPVGVCTTAQMPSGWFPWWVSQTQDNEPWQNRMPEYKPVCPFDPCPFPDRVKGGAQAMQYFTFHSTHTAGAWQRVQVPAGANLRFSIWGQAWSSATDKVPSDFPTVVNMRVGIDPTGGTNPFSGSIVWSGTANPYDNYRLFEVDATSQGDFVTVFMWSQPLEARKHNDIYWDEASLVVGGGGSAVPSAPAGSNNGSSSAPAAPAFVPGPTPTPNAEGIILTQVQAGDTMWAIAARSGISLDEFLELNPGLTRETFIKVGDLYVTGFGDPGGAPPPPDENKPTEENGTKTDPEPPADGAKPEDAPPPPEADTQGGGADAPPPPRPEATAEPTATGGAICLRAFDDANRDGIFDTGETIKNAVAFTISSGQAVVSNYVTDGSEPYCIEGLPAGTYRVSRSFIAKEVSTGSGDWGIAISDGSRFDLDFGSYIDTTAEPEAVAQANNAPPANNTQVTEASLTDNTTNDATEAEASDTNWTVWIVGLIVAIAAVLLIGVTFIILSARRAG